MLTRRSFISASAAAVLGAAALALPACGGSRGSAASASSAAASSSASFALSEAASASAASAAASSAASGSSAASSASSASAGAQAADSLVIYFSRTGENYQVGYIEEGNTAIVAKAIADRTGAGMFEIVPAQEYPQGYNECCDVAQAELGSRARPAYVGDVDLSSYKTIYLGYPIWWGDLPMCVYTFLEAHDWAGKDIRPFCTHGGSGLSGTATKIQEACAGSTVGEGLAIAGTTAQNSRAEAEAQVEAWLG